MEIGVPVAVQIHDGDRLGARVLPDDDVVELRPRVLEAVARFEWLSHGLSLTSSWRAPRRQAASAGWARQRAACTAAARSPIAPTGKSGISAPAMTTTDDHRHDEAQRIRRAGRVRGRLELAIPGVVLLVGAGQRGPRLRHGDGERRAVHEPEVPLAGQQRATEQLGARASAPPQESQFMPKESRIRPPQGSRFAGGRAARADAAAAQHRGELQKKPRNRAPGINVLREAQGHAVG